MADLKPGETPAFNEILDLLKNPVITRCNHNFCRFCITEFLKNKTSVPCPLCKESVTKRSLQEQDRLNEIVTHVRGLITAYQEDTGELFSPPRDHQVDSAFFPCTPEHIFSQENKPQAEQRRQPKRNVKHVKKTQAAVDLEENDTLNDVRNILGLEDGSEFQEPQDFGQSTSTGTSRVRRSRTSGKAAASRDDRVGHVAKAGTRSRSDLEKEKALLRYLDEGSCGVVNNGDSEAGAAVVSDDQHDDNLSKSLDNKNRDDDIGESTEIMEVDLNAEIEPAYENFENVIENSTDGKELSRNLGPVCVVENMTLEDLQNVDHEMTESPTRECNPSTKNVLDLTPESAYEGEECDTGDELFLFQSQEVKQKEKAQKVTLSIYSGKKTEIRSSRNNRMHSIFEAKPQYEADFDHGSMMSSLESPNNFGRDFQNLAQVKTYSKSRVEKNKKNSMVKQWVQKAQEATGNHSFSESDSQMTEKSARIPNGHKGVSTDAQSGVEFDDFGFSSLIDSTDEDGISLIRSSALVQPTQGATQNRKKIFKTKITKQTRPDSDSVKHPEAELPSSDPYEFKSSQTSQNNQNKKKQSKKKGRKPAKGKKESKSAGMTGKAVSATTERKDYSQTTRHTREEGEAAVEGDDDLIEIESEKKVKAKKEKHVRFDLKSPEQEMNHLINKIGEAEDHDFLFSTQEAMSNMAEQEEEESVFPQLEEVNIDEAEGVDFTTVTDSESNQVDRKVKSDTESQVKHSASNSSGTDKSQSLSVVPPTPSLPIRPMEFTTKGKVKKPAVVTVVQPVLVVSETPVTVVPKTPLLQEAQGEMTRDKANNDHLLDDIHLTDSESCSQMPLPIPRKMKGTKKLKPKHLPKEVILDASQSTGSGKSHVSPTPKKLLNRKEGQEFADNIACDDNLCSEDSSSTEDLNITPDHTEFEEANLDLQPDDVRQQLSQMSQESVNKAALTEEVNQHAQHQEMGNLMQCEDHSNSGSPLARDEQKSSLDTSSVHCGETDADKKKRAVAGYIKRTDTTVGSTNTVDIEGTETCNKIRPESGDDRATTNQINESGGNSEVPKSIEEPSPDVIEDTVQSSIRSTRSCRTRENQKKTGNMSLGLKPRVTKKCPKKNKASESKVIEIEDSEEEHDCGSEAVKSDMRTVGISVPVDSQASTVPTSLQPESLQDDQTLPPDECMDDLVDSQDQEVQEQVIETATADVSTGVPETVTESVSLLDSLDEEEDEDALDVTSSKSQEASTLESVSILHDLDKGEPTAADKGRSKQKKRKHCEEATLESVTPTTPKDQLQDSSVPEVSSAPITVTLEDSDDEMLVVRRPKRKCFSLDGSPLKARAKSARARLTRRTKPCDRSHLSEGQGNDQHKSGPEPMDTEVHDKIDFNSQSDSKVANENNKDDSVHNEVTTKQLSQANESEDLQLINTIPDFSERQQSMEDIFNRNSEMTCVVVPSDTEDVISNSIETGKKDIKDTDASKSTTVTPKQASQKKVKRSPISDSDTSDSDDNIQSTSVQKGIRAVRGLASREKKIETSPVVLSSGSPSVSLTGSSSQKRKNVLDSVSQSEEHVKESQSSRRRLTLQDSECLGPTPNNINISNSNKKPTGKRAKNSRGHTSHIPSDSECGDSDNDITIIQSSGSDLSGRARRRQTNSKERKKESNNTKGIDLIRDCQVGISPSDQIIQGDMMDEEEEEAETLQEDQFENARSHTVYSSSDEEFVLRDDDEVIRKAEMPTVDDAYTELPQTSSPIQCSPRGEDSGDESDVAPPGARKTSRPIITDSDSDEDSYHSDQQMNFTSSSAFSSQSEVLTTQQQGKLEKDMEEMREKIRRLEALKDEVLEKGEVTEVEECTNETPDVIPPTNKTKEEEDSSSDGELFLSPMSPSPPPPVTTAVSEGPAWTTVKTSQKVIEAFKIIDKYKSPDLSKSKQFLEGVRSSNKRKDNDGSSDDGELCGTSSKPSPALSKKTGARTLKKEISVDSDESDLPLVKSPLGSRRRVKKERLPVTDQPSGSRKVLSPLTFENRKKTVSKQIVMITSGLAGEQMVSVQEFLGKTGSTFFPKFHKTVTHVIVRKAVGESDPICDRTLKYFQGVVAKCWVLSFDWVQDSLQAGKPLPEDQYEMIGDTVSREHHYGPRRSRLSQKKLFTGFTFACIGVSREMTKDDMRVLVQLGGAELAEDPWELGNMKSTIRLIIRCLDFEERPNESEIETFNNFYKHYHLVTVSREWVLDSISSFHIQPLKEDYVVNTLKKIVLPF